MTQYAELIMRCPACLKDGKPPGAETQWYHANCGGKLLVGSNAKYKCDACNHESHVKGWRYACETHKGEYKNTDSAHLANALSVAGQITGKMGKQWLMEFLANMGEDW